MEVKIYNLEGKESGHGTVPDALFAGRVVESLLWEAVNAQRASWRQGTHDTKTRAHVRGGGAKPYKQKGTGQARQGSSRAPNHVGGGVVFGPHPRDYAYKLPKQARRAALRSALSSRGLEKRVALLDVGAFSQASTKVMAALLTAIGQPRTLVVGSTEKVLHQSTRNLAKAKYIDVDGLNVYDVVNHDFILLTQEAVSQLEQRLARQSAETELSDAA